MTLACDISALGKRPLVMGIVNVTPDSFSGDGLLQDQEAAAVSDQARAMTDAGADILDIGGESSRPGHAPVSVETELSRIIPAIHAIRAYCSVPLSIDTVKPEVADQALAAGVAILNDVSGENADPALYQIAARHGAYLVLMHNKAEVSAVDPAPGAASYAAADSPDIVAEVYASFERMIVRAEQAGVSRARMILDPGLGFGKTVRDNLRLVHYLDAFLSLKLPLLSAPSRKSFIGRILDSPPEDRLEGTMAAITLSLLKGADIVRVHDVKEAVRTAKMTLAFIKA